jgi:iron complex outermembrane recepter protein
MRIKKHPSARSRRVRQVLTVLTMGLPYAWCVWAQQAPSESPKSAEIQEVVVTAQKRLSAIEDVPFSVAAETEHQIRDAGAESIVDLARNVTSLTVADLGPGQSQVAIRGISSGQVIRDQPGVKEQVGIYLDETPISVALFTPDLELFDIDRFEVLRGPQGTLFGAGSEAGTIRYITVQPKLGVWEAIAENDFEHVTGGSFGGYARFAANMPLTDAAAVRITGYYHHLPGFIDAIQPDGSVHKAVNDGDRAGGRIALLVKPTDALSITPRFMYQTLSTNGYPRVDLYNILANPYTTTQPPVTIGDREQFTQEPEGLNDKFWLTDLKADYVFGPVALTSVSSYSSRELLVLRDSTQLTGSVTFDLGGNSSEVRTNAPLYDRTRLDVFSQELRLASTGTGPLQWLVGGFYQHQRRRYGQDLPVAGYDAFQERVLGVNSAAFDAPPDTAFLSDIRYRFRQYALFGEATYNFTNHWSVTAGARYYNFKEDRVLNFLGLFAAPINVNVPGETSSSGTSPRVILTYKIDEDHQFNLQAARGFRLGGINDPINIGLCTPQDVQIFGHSPSWKDETMWNYEVGSKMRLADRRVTFNISAFYADIKDLQATTTAGTCSSRIVFNVPKARSMGLEAELFARPNATWDFGLSATVVDATLRSSVISTLADGSQVVVGGLQEGNRLPTAPKVQAVGSLGYTYPLAQARDVFANLTVQYVGSSYSQFENEAPNFGEIGGNAPGAARLILFANPPLNTVITFNPELPSYTLGNFRLGLKTDRWEMAAYVDNIWDETAHLALDYERGRSARVGYLTNQPRTVGLYGRLSF